MQSLCTARICVLAALWLSDALKRAAPGLKCLLPLLLRRKQRVIFGADVGAVSGVFTIPLMWARVSAKHLVLFWYTYVYLRILALVLNPFQLPCTRLGWAFNAREMWPSWLKRGIGKNANAFGNRLNAFKVVWTRFRFFTLFPLFIGKVTYDSGLCAIFELVSFFFVKDFGARLSVHALPSFMYPSLKTRKIRNEFHEFQRLLSSWTAHNNIDCCWMSDGRLIWLRYTKRCGWT